MRTILLTGKRAREAAPVVVLKIGRPREAIAVLISTDAAPDVKSDLVLTVESPRLAKIVGSGRAVKL